MKKFLVKNSLDDTTDIEFVVSQHLNLEQMLEEFGRFLKAIGYVFDGYLDIVDYDDLK